MPLFAIIMLINRCNVLNTTNDNSNAIVESEDRFVEITDLEFRPSVNVGKEETAIPYVPYQPFQLFCGALNQLASSRRARHINRAEFDHRIIAQNISICVRQLPRPILQ